MGSSIFGVQKVDMHVYNRPTVIVRGVAKTYYAEKRRAERLCSSKKKNSDVHALRDVSFVAEEGEFIGILGRNGSGKSTLMRLIAGTEAPSQGEILVSAKPTLLGVSAALQPKLTGRENIKLGLFAQGIHPKQLEKMSEDIQEFADIGTAIDRPMADYSSGMGSRLKFAISTAVKRDILLVDEALSTGDATFNERARGRMNEFLVGSGTIFLVSHALPTIKEMCGRAIWIDQGVLIADGDVEEVTWQYRRWAARFARRNYEGADEVIQENYEAVKDRNILLMSQIDDYFAGAESSSIEAP